MSGATRTLYLDDEFLRRTVGNVRRLNSQLPGAFFFDRRPAAVPAAGLLLEINIGERLAAVVARQSTLPTLRLTTAAGSGLGRFNLCGSAPAAWRYVPQSAARLRGLLTGSFLSDADDTSNGDGNCCRSSNGQLAVPNMADQTHPQQPRPRPHRQDRQPQGPYPLQQRHRPCRHVRFARSL